MRLSFSYNKEKITTVAHNRIYENEATKFPYDYCRFRLYETNFYFAKKYFVFIYHNHHYLLQFHKYHEENIQDVLVTIHKFEN